MIAWLTPSICRAKSSRRTGMSKVPISSPCTSCSKNYPLSITAGKDHLFYLSTQLSVYGKVVRSAITDTDELGDADTADLFTGISRDVDKYLWFLEAHLQEKA